MRKIETNNAALTDFGNLNNGTLPEANPILVPVRTGKLQPSANNTYYRTKKSAKRKYSPSLHP